MQHRGQVVSSDMYISFFIFMIIVATVTMFWLTQLASLSEKNLETINKTAAIRSADLLMKTEGKPYNWQALGMDQIIWPGLANRFGNFSEEKLNRFVAMAQADVNYLQAKEMFGINNDFYFILKNSLGEEIKSTGKKITRIQTEKIIIKEVVYYNRDYAQAEFTVFQEK